MKGIAQHLRRCRAALIALLALTCGGHGSAYAQAHLEDAVKATFLQRFAAFAEWPASAFASFEDAFVICMTGPADLATLVERGAFGQRVGVRLVEVRRLERVTRGSGCHVLFAGGTQAQSVRETLAAVAGEPVLTVTDERYGSARGVIHFAIVDSRVRFHIDRTMAETNHIGLSARLLGIALTVRGARS